MASMKQRKKRETTTEISDKLQSGSFTSLVETLQAGLETVASIDQGSLQRVSLEHKTTYFTSYMCRKHSLCGINIKLQGLQQMLFAINNCSNETCSTEMLNIQERLTLTQCWPSNQAFSDIFTKFDHMYEYAQYLLIFFMFHHLASTLNIAPTRWGWPLQARNFPSGPRLLNWRQTWPQQARL